MSQTAFAKLFDVSQPRISALIAEGRLSCSGSKLKMPDAYNQMLIIQGESSGNKSDNKSVDTNAIYQKAKAFEKSHKAKLAELAVKEKQGKLIPIEDVISEVQKISEITRNELISLPNKLSGQLENKPAAEIQVILRRAVNEILTSCYELSMKYDESILNNEKSSK